MAGPIDIAYVEILPDLKAFSAIAKKQIQASLRGVSDAADDAAKKMSKSFKTSFDEIDKIAKDRLSGVKDKIVNSFDGIGRLSGEKFLTGLALAIAANPGAIIGSVLAIAAPIAAAFAGAIPAAVATGVAAIGTFTIAISGLEDALKNIGDVDKFNKALEGLAPSAQKFAVAIKDVFPQLRELRNAVQERFFVGFDQDVKKLVATLKGPLTEGLTGIAAEFNAAGRDITNFATSAQSIESINSILIGTRNILNTLRPAIVPIAEAFTTLAVVAQPQLDELARKLTETATSFSNFIAQAGSTGQLTAFFEEANRIVTNLSTGFANLGDIVSSIFAGMGKDGDALAQDFVILTQSLKDFFATAEAQGALGALGEVLSGVRDVIQDMLVAVVPLLPAITGLITGGFDILKGTLDGILAVLTPVIALFGDSQTAFTVIGGAITAAVIALKAYEGVLLLVRVATAAWAAIQLILNGALFANPIGIIVLAIVALVGGLIAAYKHSAAFREIVDAVGNALKTAFLATVDAVGTAISAIGEFFSNVGSGISDAFDDVVSFFSELPSRIGAGFAAIGSAISDFFSMLGGVISSGIDSIIDFFAALPGALLDIIIMGLKGILFVFGLYIGLIIFAVTKLPGMIIDAIVALPGILANFFTNLWNNIVLITTTIWDATIAFFTALPGRILAAVMSLLTTLGGFFTGLWNSITSFAVSAWDAIVLFFTELPGRIVAGVTALANSLTTFFSNLWNTVRDLTVTGFNAVLDFIRSVPGRITNLISGFANAGKDLIRGFFNGLSAAGGFARDVGNAILGAFKSALNFAIRGINSGIRKVGDFIPGGLPTIPEVASGGLITGPTLATVGERGAELVLPLTGQRGRNAIQTLQEEMGDGQTGVRRWSGGPQVVEVNITVDSGGTKMDELLVQLLRKAIRVQGGNVQKVLGQGVGV